MDKTRINVIPSCEGDTTKNLVRDYQEGTSVDIVHTAFASTNF
jgi:hypothetical protein